MTDLKPTCKLFLNINGPNVPFNKQILFNLVIQKC